MLPKAYRPRVHTGASRREVPAVPTRRGAEHRVPHAQQSGLGVRGHRGVWRSARRGWAVTVIASQAFALGRPMAPPWPVLAVPPTHRLLSTDRILSRACIPDHADEKTHATPNVLMCRARHQRHVAQTSGSSRQSPQCDGRPRGTRSAESCAISSALSRPHGGVPKRRRSSLR